MTRSITIKIKADGSVEVLTSGFAGPSCIAEFEKIAAAMSNLGVQLETREIVPLTEYYLEGARSDVRARTAKT